jgi:DNA-binding NarL/FixJ family response regulator
MNHGQTPSGRPAGNGPLTQIRILLVDDQPLFRRAIATLIDEQDDLTVVGEAVNGVDALEQARALAPDLVIMDIEMPVMDGVEAARLLHERQPTVKILILTVSDSDDRLFEAIRVGVDGYLLKDLRPEQLYDMIRAAMRDETPVSPLVAGRLLQEFRNGTATRQVTTAPADNPAVTRRELEILQLVADGMSNKEIGRQLSITEGTVKNHVHNALEKLHLDNRIQAAAYVVRRGLGHSTPGS